MCPRNWCSDPTEGYIVFSIPAPWALSPGFPKRGMKRIPSEPAPDNATDFIEIGVCFLDRSIGLLFAALLEARGIHARSVRTPTDLDPHSRVITEAHFVPNLTADQLKQCLVVGEPDQLERLEVLGLSRPLTEDKVEDALSAFLRL